MGLDRLDDSNFSIRAEIRSWLGSCDALENGVSCKHIRNVGPRVGTTCINAGATEFCAAAAAREESAMRNLIKRFIREEEGATMVEYGLMVALIAVVSIAIITVLGTEVATAFDKTQVEVGKANDSGPMTPTGGGGGGN